ncbi:MFS transporter [Streptomyces monticola]|uniref:MFS transporter n=1 Tax=Streptomyces monticola TaxID=2666263 RepID=A0ABW2JDJ4_9ACTN
MDQLIAEDPARIGAYRLIARLGAGGMGLVYLGRSEAGRTVAVKVVQEEYAQHHEFRRRFAREVAAARRVGGSWTAAVLDADTQAPVPWVATQYIPGPDLQTVVADDFGPLPEDSLRVLANRLALALEAVHRAGLLHRDLKPSNVLVTVDGPRLIDFGIVRALDSISGDSLHTRTGMLIGSPGFMSPEQVRGHQLTPASDVFCLGAVLVYAATGRLLFGAGDTALHAHLFRIAEDEADLSGLPASLAELVAACLHKDPAQRPTPAQIAARTDGDDGNVWLPGEVLAQLGRHAAQLLDFAPEVRAGAATAALAESPAEGPAESPAHSPAESPTQSPAAQPDTLIAPAQPEAPAHTPTVPAQSGPARDEGQVPAAAPARSRKWGLAALALAQLMVLVDATTYTLATESLGGGSASNREYPPVYAHLLAFVGLLLLGGRLVDLVGRRRILVIGLSGFAAASAVGGSTGSYDGDMQVVTRALQGGFGALVTASVLAQVLTGSADRQERRRALGVYAAVVGSGSAVALFVDQQLDLPSSYVPHYTNVLLAAIALLGLRALPHDPPRRTGQRLDMTGVLLSALGLASFVYGFVKAGSFGWSHPFVLGMFASGSTLFAVFLWWQTKTSSPLLAPHIIRDRHRLGGLLTLVLVQAGINAGFVIDTTSQDVARLSLLLMIAATVLGTSRLPARLLPHDTPRFLTVTGVLTTALGLVVLWGSFGTYTVYTAQLLPAMFVTGLGTGLTLRSLFATATAGIAPEHVGAASAAVFVAQQVGEAIGLGFLERHGHVLNWMLPGLLLAALTAALMLRARGAEKP